MSERSQSLVSGLWITGLHLLLVVQQSGAVFFQSLYADLAIHEYNTFTMSSLQKHIGITVVLLFSLFLIIPFFSHGFFPMHDDTQVGRVFEMTKALKDGQFPVRWVEDLGYGYGYPIFNFYAPFAYYVGSLFNLVGFDALVSTKITFALAIILSGVFMYLFVKDTLDTYSGIVASVIYMYFPYHAVNIYVRGALSEIWAYAFIPIVFWGIWRTRIENEQLSMNKGLREIIMSSSFGWAIITALGFTFIILSHNLSAYMVGLFSALCMAIGIIFSKRRIRLLSLYSFSVIFAVVLSAFYILPVALEAGYTNVVSQIGKSADYHDHFVCLSQLWDSPWGFGGSVAGCTDGLSFKLGKTNILFALFSVGIFLYTFFSKKKKYYSVLVVISMAFLSLFLLLPISEFIWDHLPGIQYLQYPWRFLNFTAFSLSILIGLSIYFIQKIVSTRVAILTCAVIIFATFLYNAKLFMPQTINANNTKYYTDKEIINWDTSRKSDEYLPRGFVKPQFQKEVPQQKVSILNGNGQFEIVSEKTQEVVLKANLASASVVHFNMAYFPGWNVAANNMSITPVPAQNGFDITLPSGSYLITAQLRSTKVQIIGNIITLIGILGLFIGIIRRKQLNLYDKKTS